VRELRDRLEAAKEQERQRRLAAEAAKVAAGAAVPAAQLVAPAQQTVAAPVAIPPPQPAYTPAPQPSAYTPVPQPSAYVPVPQPVVPVAAKKKGGAGLALLLVTLLVVLLAAGGAGYWWWFMRPAPAVSMGILQLNAAPYAEVVSVTSQHTGKSMPLPAGDHWTPLRLDGIPAGEYTVTFKGADGSTQSRYCDVGIIEQVCSIELKPIDDQAIDQIVGGAK